eukprot:scaffold238416_cov36-Tisochrysis_lutea.AAC.3
MVTAAPYGCPPLFHVGYRQPCGHSGPTILGNVAMLGWPFDASRRVWDPRRKYVRTWSPCISHACIFMLPHFGCLPCPLNTLRGCPATFLLSILPCEPDLNRAPVVVHSSSLQGE